MGVSSDADVPVKKQRAPPVASARHALEDGALKHGGALIAGKPYRAGGHVDAQGHDTAPRQGCDVAAGAAADIEHGSSCMCKHRLVGRRKRAEPFLRRKLDHSSICAHEA